MLLILYIIIIIVIIIIIIINIINIIHRSFDLVTRINVNFFKSKIGRGLTKENYYT